jgi:hypothetical protein
LLFIRKNVLEVWPQIDVKDRIESRCPLDTWTSDLSIFYGLGQTPKDVDEEDCPRSLCLYRHGVIGLTARFFLIFPICLNLKERATNDKANGKITR